jgi:2-oxoglutarate dehydrogenase E1 component
MYQVIRKKPTVRQLYADKLAADGVIVPADAASMMEQYRNGLDEGKPQARAAQGLVGNKYTVDWSEYLGADWSEPVKTAVDIGRLRALGKAITTYPTDWKLQPRVLAVMQAREKMVMGDLALDWGAAENLAYATLIQDGYPIRLTGQDSGRGTFFHRHAVLHDQASGRRYIPLQHLASTQPTFTVTDSLLSEEAVLGFEYGFSTTEPHCLTIWEAQFGDFCNGAQVVVDQFISSGEAKWGRLSGITLFLPHGYEGQGPEHSSARLERFLQLCAEFNIQVCVPSTPAQMFHMLRRQMVRDLRKPLIVLTPKSLLRHPLSVSRLEELSLGGFQNVIDDVDDLKSSEISRIVFCSGKVYFDLLKSRREAKIKNVAVVRIEQLYPFPSDEYEAILRKYGQAREIVWCQEEPQNQGSWYQIRHRLQSKLGPKHELLYAGRAGAAAPATGIAALHERQQKNLVTAALQGEPPEETSRQTMRLPVAQSTRTGLAGK